MPKNAWILVATLVVTLAGVSCLQAQAVERKPDPLAEKVKAAIDKGVTYLREQGKKDGDWENVDTTLFSKGHPGAFTSLALLALLNSGVPADDPLVTSGLASLRKIGPDSTYEVSLQTMVFAQVGLPVDKERIQKSVDWLLEARQQDGWTYDKNRGAADNSNTQYALLALNEARRVGANVDPKALEAIQQTYLRLQNKRTGSWGYNAQVLEGRFTMTTAGVCGLLITGMNREKDHAELLGDGSDPKCGKYDDNAEVAHGLKWLADRFPAKLEARKMLQQSLIPPYYCLYGLERCGRLSGERYLGDKDWYRIGCEFLVEQQQVNGAWKGSLGGEVPSEPWPVVATSLSLLFLSKGRTPVLWTKMAWGQKEELGWNNKHHDARNLTEFASRELFKNQPLGWQVFDIRNHNADTKERRTHLAEDLLQSPIVFLSGHQLLLDDKQKDVLKEYLANGGFLFAEACCNSPQFDKDFKALLKEFYPDSTLTPLDPGHPVWAARYPLVPGKPFPLFGIQEGCKTVVIYSPRAVSGYWEANKFADKENGTKAFQLGANVIAYATGLEPPKPKGYEMPIVRPDQRENIERGYLKVAQLRYTSGGDWHPAPNAMRKLMGETRKVGLDVVLETKPLDLRDANVVDYRFLYMHGRNQFTIPNKDDLKTLLFHLEENGGLLFADACCGSKDFDSSFRKLIGALWADKKLEPIPVDDDLFGKELNGVEIKEVRCRREGPDGKTPDEKFQRFAPKLEGIKIKGRWVVIYSPYDIGCALENNKSSDCKGHDYDSAVLLARAAVLYALKR